MSPTIRFQYPGCTPTIMAVTDRIAASPLSDILSRLLLSPEQKLGVTRASFRLSAAGQTRRFSSSTTVAEAISCFEATEICVEVVVRAIGGGR